MYSVSHQHDRIFTDEETNATIGSHQLPVPLNWKVLVQPNQVKTKTTCKADFINPGYDPWAA